VHNGDAQGRADPTTKHPHRAKAVRTKTAPKIIKHKKVAATKLIEPAQTEAPPVIAPLGRQFRRW